MDAPQFTNTLKDREIDLRERKIPAIENLGTTLDQFDTYDFSDNEIRRLGGFPRFLRLKTLVLINNRVSRIAADLSESIPNLMDVNLKNNNISHLAALKALAPCAKLVRLCLVGNPVFALENYRLYVIHILPQLKLLDFQKIKEEERRQSQELFDSEAGAALLEKIDSQTSGTGKGSKNESAVAENSDAGASRSGPTSEEMAKIRAEIAKAGTLEEVAALEAKLKAGEFGVANMEE